MASEDDLRDEVLSALSERSEQQAERTNQLEADLDALVAAHATESEGTEHLRRALAAQSDATAALLMRLAELEARLERVEAAVDLGQR